MSDQPQKELSWPTHGSRGRHDWWTYLERGYLDPFRDVLATTPGVVDAVFDDAGRTMLMYAVATSSALVGMLIKAGADVNRRDAHGRPVWDFVPRWGPQWVDVWRLLIEAGLDVNSRAPGGQTPLISVCGVYVDPKTSNEYIQSKLDIVRLLLNAGAQVNVTDQYNVSPLAAAASARSEKVVKLLRKAGADPNLPAHGNRTPLFEAAVRGGVSIVQSLLNSGPQSMPRASAAGCDLSRCLRPATWMSRESPR